MNISLMPLGFLEYWGIYRAKRRSGAPEVGTTHMGLLARPRGLCPPRGTPQAQPGPVVFLLAHKNSLWSFVACGLRLILISCHVKNMKKTATGTWHYVNRLVPKMM